MEAPGQMRVVVVIASLTRGFAVPEADTPPAIRPCAAPLQDQDEKGSLFQHSIQATAQARDPQGLDQQHATGLRDDSSAVSGHDRQASAVDLVIT
jgi:hypothetical protein